MIRPDNVSRYSVDRLLTIFTTVRDNKQANIDRLGYSKPGSEWTQSWPDGNTRAEQACVDALQAWKDAGVKEVETTLLLGDKDPSQPGFDYCGIPQASFYNQLKAGYIKPVV